MPRERSTRRRNNFNNFQHYESQRGRREIQGYGKLYSVLQNKILMTIIIGLLLLICSHYFEDSIKKILYQASKIGAWIVETVKDVIQWSLKSATTAHDVYEMKRRMDNETRVLDYDLFKDEVKGTINNISASVEEAYNLKMGKKLCETGCVEEWQLAVFLEKLYNVKSSERTKKNIKNFQEIVRKCEASLLQYIKETPVDKVKDLDIKNMIVGCKITTKSGFVIK